MTDRATGSSECKEHLASCISHFNIQQRAVQGKMHAHNIMAVLEAYSTHRIICLPLITWNDAGLVDSHVIIFLFYMSMYVHMINDH